MCLSPERLDRAVYSTGGLTLEFEKALSADEFEIYPICVKGKRASPADDLPERLIKILKDL
jgi:hypothetical protein